MEKILERWKKSNSEKNCDQFAIDDFDFHLCIAKMSKNTLIEYVLTILKDPIIAHITEMNKRLGFELNMNHHINVFEAIKRGDDRAASFYMEEALKRSIAKMKELETTQ